MAERASWDIKDVTRHSTLCAVTRDLTLNDVTRESRLSDVTREPTLSDVTRESTLSDVTLTVERVDVVGRCAATQGRGISATAHATVTCLLTCPVT